MWAGPVFMFFAFVAVAFRYSRTLAWPTLSGNDVYYELDLAVLVSRSRGRDGDELSFEA